MRLRLVCFLYLVSLGVLWPTVVTAQVAEYWAPPLGFVASQQSVGLEGVIGQRIMAQERICATPLVHATRVSPQEKDAAFARCMERGADSGYVVLNQEGLKCVPVVAAPDVSLCLYPQTTWTGNTGDGTEATYQAPPLVFLSRTSAFAQVPSTVANTLRTCVVAMAPLLRTGTVDTQNQVFTACVERATSGNLFVILGDRVTCRTFTEHPDMRLCFFPPVRWHEDPAPAPRNPGSPLTGSQPVALNRLDDYLS